MYEYLPGAVAVIYSINGDSGSVAFQNESGQTALVSLETVAIGAGARGPFYAAALSPGEQAHFDFKLHGFDPAELAFYSEGFTESGEILIQDKVVPYGHVFGNPLDMF